MQGSCVIFPCAFGCLFILLIPSEEVILCPRCLLLSQTKEDFSHSLRGRSNTCKTQERCQGSNGFKSFLYAELWFTPTARLTTMWQRNVVFNQQTKSWPICKHGAWVGRGRARFGEICCTDFFQLFIYFRFLRYCHRLRARGERVTIRKHLDVDKLEKTGPNLWIKFLVSNLYTPPILF